MSLSYKTFGKTINVIIKSNYYKTDYIDFKSYHIIKKIKK